MTRSSTIGRLSIQDLSRSLISSGHLLSEPYIASRFATNYAIFPPVSSEKIVRSLSRDLDIIEKPIESASGVSLIIEDRKPVIYYNGKSRPATFTVLHEVRHIIDTYLAEHPNYEIYASSTNIERRCELFAAEVLMPGAHFIAQCSAGIDVPALRKYYQVSYTAVCIRLNYLLGIEFQISENGKVLSTSRGYLSEVGMKKTVTTKRHSISLAVPDRRQWMRS